MFLFSSQATALHGGGGISRVGWRGGRGRPWRSTFTRKPRCSRRAIIRAPWTSPVAAYHLAAVEVRFHLELVKSVACQSGLIWPQQYRVSVKPRRTNQARIRVFLLQDPSVIFHFAVVRTLSSFRYKALIWRVGSSLLCDVPFTFSRTSRTALASRYPPKNMFCPQFPSYSWPIECEERLPSGFESVVCTQSRANATVPSLEHDSSF